MKIVKLDEKDMLIERLKQENKRLKRQLEEQDKVIAAQIARLVILEPLEAKNPYLHLVPISVMQVI